jgi:glucosamine--fructose-6-phosphate aminotransferase (isomerizing)
MCGIVGYIGQRQAQGILLNGLKRLEYRGYDSSGISLILAGKNKLSVTKSPGKIAVLESTLKKKPLSGTLGIGHCLAPDTYVFLSDGRIKRISGIHNHESVISADLVTLKCRNSTHIKSFRHKSPKILYQIKTAYFTFVATGEHRIFTAKPTGEIIEQKIKDITSEYLIAIPRKISGVETSGSYRLKPVEVEKHFIITSLGRAKLKQHRIASHYSWRGIKNITSINSTYIKRIETGKRILVEKTRLMRLLQYYNLKFSPRFFESKNFTTNDVFLPRFSNDKLMQVIGYFSGDGHIQERMIRFKEGNKEICEIYRSLFGAVFRINSNLRKKTGHYVFTINSRLIANWFRSNFPELIRPMPEKDFPEFVGGLPKAQIANLLRGIFDAEGCVGLRGGQISLRMTSRHIIQKVQLLLLRFGILATYTETKRKIKNWNDVFGLNINDKESMVNFYKYVGFSMKKKQDKVLYLMNNMKGNTSKYFSFPMRSDLFYKNYLKLNGFERHKINSWVNNSYITNFRLSKIMDTLKQNGNGQAMAINEVVNKFINSDFVWVKQKTTRIYSPYKFVYDLEVEPAANFIGNGVLQHNSRWATHGAPTQANAHPHQDCKGEVVIVHNGIIENYASLKSNLIKEGHRFLSQTDTEVIAHLIEKFYQDIPIEEAVRKALSLLVGSFAIGVISKKEPHKLIGARLGSPLILGIGKNENFLASDVSAVLDYTKEVVFLEENELVVLTKDSLNITDLNGMPLKRNPVRITWDIAQAQKQGYKHFMLKEINEQPKIIENFLNLRIQKDAPKISFEELRISEDALKKITHISIVACGSAYHAGLAGKYILESLCAIPVNVDVSSEFRYRDLLIDKETLVIAVSQSGETADTLAGIRQAKKLGANVLSICNVLGSSITRESDGVIYTHAGPEIGVASTKAYTAQLLTFYLFALYLARVRNSLAQEKIAGHMEDLKKIPQAQEEILKNQDIIARLSRKHSHFGSFLFLGRHVNFPSALEGALKLKEISYIPAEGYAAGEMKHGPIALIDEYRAVVCIVTESRVYEKMISSFQEILARRGKIIAIATTDDTKIKEQAKEVIYVPRCNELFSPLLVALPLQLLAYHIALKRGCDVDQPRNLAKSVTVE